MYYKCSTEPAAGQRRPRIPTRRRISRAQAGVSSRVELDTLTGLPTRSAFTHVLHSSLQPAIGTASAQDAELIFINLDRYARFNEALGQAQGDALLQCLAARLRTACPNGSTVARWGSDEFVVFAPAGLPGGRLAEHLLDVIGRPLTLDGLTLSCSASLGVVRGNIGRRCLPQQPPHALSPHHHEAVDTPLRWLARAETAMRRAKADGGGRCMVATSTHTGCSASGWTREMLALEARLHQAVGLGSLALHYQPQVEPGTGRPVGLEALLRWHQPGGDLWAPSQFMALAEECGAIVEIGAWVIHEACAQMKRWQAQGLAPLPVSVNVSARQCQDHRLVDVVRSALRNTGLDPALLTLEITETTALVDVDLAAHLLTDLRRLGVGIAIDDFGTGYSSLAHLTRLPLSQIKIDQSFMRRVDQGGQGAAIVRSTIELAHRLGLPVVAEGVESAGQLGFLAAERCDIAQGYFCSRPLAPEAVGPWLQRATSGLN
jgi:diguanylate cyclase (GGDEF)-like protein